MHHLVLPSAAISRMVLSDDVNLRKLAQSEIEARLGVTVEGLAPEVIDRMSTMSEEDLRLLRRLLDRAVQQGVLVQGG
ncbi:MAG TPA: hypothetical protein VES67_15030 [Vicinamibacterales bacterium]|nr:hypothetical protein [Vicinamibacterales bacterium]